MTSQTETSDDTRAYSDVVSQALDVLGYSYEMVKARQKAYKDLAHTYQHSSIAPKSFQVIIAGSRADGLCGQFESDLDIMQVLTDVVCVENASNHPISHQEDAGLPGNSIKMMDKKVTFSLERKYVSEGYAFLKFDGTAQNVRNEILNSLVKFKGDDLYLSSDCFCNEMRNTSTQSPLPAWLNRPVTGRAGPALESHQPKQLQSFPLEQDMVFALPCRCDTIYQQWASRPRKHGWPSADLIARIGTLDAHVVPVGFKPSKHSDKEWRITYTQAEIALVHELNETLTKVYATVKMIIKKFISPIDKNIMTSYMIKNLILWLAELCPRDYFSTTYLIKLMQLLITVMKQCLNKQWLPSFMIPKRNLLKAINPETAEIVANKLTTILEMKGSILMDCGPLEQEIKRVYGNPIRSQQWANKRDEVENMLFYIMISSLDNLKNHHDNPSELELAALVPHNGVCEVLLEKVRQILRSSRRLQKCFVVPCVHNLIDQGRQRLLHTT